MKFIVILFFLIGPLPVQASFISGGLAERIFATSGQASLARFDDTTSSLFTQSENRTWNEFARVQGDLPLPALNLVNRSATCDQLLQQLACGEKLFRLGTEKNEPVMSLSAPPNIMVPLGLLIALLWRRTS